MTKFALVSIAIWICTGCYYNARNFVTNGRPEPKFEMVRNVPTTVVMTDGNRKPFVDVMIRNDSLLGWTQDSASTRRDSVAIAFTRVARIEQRKRSKVMEAVAVVSSLLGVALAVVLLRTGGA